MYPYTNINRQWCTGNVLAVAANTPLWNDTGVFESFGRLVIAL